MNKYEKLAEENKKLVQKFLQERAKRLSCTQKRKYKTYKEAAANKKQDVYLCGFCGFYHRTQRALKLRNKILRRKKK